MKPEIPIHRQFSALRPNHVGVYDDVVLARDYDELREAFASFVQAVTDPENQPSQYGTMLCTESKSWTSDKTLCPPCDGSEFVTRAADVLGNLVNNADRGGNLSGVIANARCLLEEFGKSSEAPKPWSDGCKHPVLTSSPTTANRCASCGKVMPLPEPPSEECSPK